MDYFWEVTVAPDSANFVGGSLQGEVVIARVRNAYFAKKIVENAGTSVRFEQINSSPVGKTVYLIVETEQMQGEQLRVSVRSRGHVLGEEEVLQVMRFDHTQIATQPYVAATEIEKTVGNFGDLNNNADAHDHYTNLDTDHADKAIIKLQLHPSTRAAFNSWTQVIGNGQVNLEITIGSEAARYGETDEVTEQGAFLCEGEGFRVENRNFYEICSNINRTNDNPYNFFQMQGANRRKIGCVLNNNSTQVVYFYYDQYGNETRIAECNRTTVMGRLNGVILTSVPPGYTSMEMPRLVLVVRLNIIITMLMGLLLLPAHIKIKSQIQIPQKLEIE